MLGWCNKCNSVAIDGFCSIHGATRPLSHICAVDIRPLTSFEKDFFNERMDETILGEGLFFVYSDRNFRKKVVTLDTPLVDIRLTKKDITITPLTKGSIEGIKLDNFIQTNKSRVNKMVEITKVFAEWELQQSKNAIISFSGGKDSIVLADVLAEFKLPKVFIDTRLEFPETYKFIHNGAGNEMPIETAKASSNFFSLCNEKGFPKRGYRWCCKSQKFEPFIRYLVDNYGNEEVAVFSGERRWEGLHRMTQPFKKSHKYVPTQQTIQPMLDWLSLDVWCYIWTHNLGFNAVYNYFDRAGCWLCPFGLEYRIFLLQYTHPKLYTALEKIGGTDRRQRDNKVNEKPCTMELDGNIVNTCEVYGHFFVNGSCFRCGTKGASIINVSDTSRLTTTRKC